jgi:hypothetical protein
MWFASTQPPFGTLMPQSGRRPQHHKLTLRGEMTRGEMTNVRITLKADIDQRKVGSQMAARDLRPPR